MNTDLTIQKQLPAIIKEAQEIIIDSPETLTISTEILSRLNKVNDSISEEKEKVLKPLREAERAERARWKPAESLLGPAIASIRSKQSMYQTAAKAQEQASKDKIAAKIGTGKGKIKLDTALSKLAAVPTTQTKVETETGSLRFRTVSLFRIIDISKVPAKYLAINETPVKAAQKANIAIPGIEYYTEERPINNR